LHWILYVLLMILACPLRLAAEEQITLATSDGIPLSNPEGTGFHDQVVREACRRIGLSLNIEHLPAERSLINANEGIEDGVYVRVEGLDAVYADLRRVPEKIGDYEFVAFGRNKDMPIAGWDSLANYHVAIVTGWKILEKNIVASRSLTKVKDASLLFRTLADDKVDLVVYNRLDGYGQLKEMKLQGIYALQAPLATREMFLYLHKSRERLIPLLSKALGEMKGDGTYDRIKKSALTAYLPQ